MALTAKIYFLRFKIIGAPKKFKNQPRPLVRSSSVNFCRNFLNLSHETVPLSFKTTTYKRVSGFANYGKWSK
jgi:hypothetical protein